MNGDHSVRQSDAQLGLTPADAVAALDALDLALATVGADGRCLHANPRADAVLTRADALCLRAGRLTANDASVARRLAEAIEAAAAPDPRAASLPVPRAGGRRPYLVCVAPLKTADGPALALVAFRDPDAAAASTAERLRQLFGLSWAEARLASLLADGLTPAEIAASRDASLNTVRTQLRAVSEKMGCRRLAQVVAMVAGLPPV